jgi:hypothetical protein
MLGEAPSGKGRLWLSAASGSSLLPASALEMGVVSSETGLKQ